MTGTRKLLREPLVGFLLAGAVIFAINSWEADGNEDRLIEVSNAQLTRISDQWQAQMGRPPSAEELSGLVDQWIREEIYYREARAMGLDDNDTIIRRRLAQKLTFLTEDLADADPSSEAELRAWYDDHQDTYLEPEKLTFSHRYFSTERRDDARADAQAALAAALAAAADPNPSQTAGGGAEAAAPTGDPFMLQQSYANRTLREIGDLFGRDFARDLDALDPDNAWQGPIRSAYGWHLVKLERRQPEHLRPFEEVAKIVGDDVQLARRRDANEALYKNLRARYDVRIAAEGP